MAKLDDQKLHPAQCRPGAGLCASCFVSRWDPSSPWDRTNLMETHSEFQIHGSDVLNMQVRTCNGNRIASPFPVVWADRKNSRSVKACCYPIYEGSKAYWCNTAYHAIMAGKNSNLIAPMLNFMQDTVYFSITFMLTHSAFTLIRGSRISNLSVLIYRSFLQLDSLLHT